MNAAITSGIVVLLVLLFMVIVLAKTVRIVPQAQSQVVERLGRNDVLNLINICRAIEAKNDLGVPETIGSTTPAP